MKRSTFHSEKVQLSGWTGAERYLFLRARHTQNLRLPFRKFLLYIRACLFGIAREDVDVLGWNLVCEHKDLLIKSLPGRISCALGLKSYSCTFVENAFAFVVQV